MAWVYAGQLPPTLLKEDDWTGSVWSKDQQPAVHRFTHPPTHGELDELDGRKVIDEKSAKPGGDERVQIGDYHFGVEDLVGAQERAAGLFQPQYGAQPSAAPAVAAPLGPPIGVSMPAAPVGPGHLGIADLAAAASTPAGPAMQQPGVQPAVQQPWGAALGREGVGVADVVAAASSHVGLPYDKPGAHVMHRSGSQIADYLAVRHPWQLPKIEPHWLPPAEVEPPPLVPLHLQRALRDRWPYAGQNFYATLYRTVDEGPAPDPALFGWGPTVRGTVGHYLPEEDDDDLEEKYKQKKWSFYKDVVQDNIVGTRSSKTDFRGVLHKDYRRQ